MTFGPSRPGAASTRRWTRARSWRLANRANDYLLDRAKQRAENFTGMRGIRDEDLAVQEDQYGAIADRTKEHLGTSDAAVIAMRRRLLAAVYDLQQGQEPPEPRRGESYRVRSLAELSRRELPFEAVASSAMPDATRENRAAEVNRWRSNSDGSREHDPSSDHQ